MVQLGLLTPVPAAGFVALMLVAAAGIPLLTAVLASVRPLLAAELVQGRPAARNVRPRRRDSVDVGAGRSFQTSLASAAS